MAYDIPLPKVVGDVGPGGGFITSLNALNDLGIKSTQARYAPYQAQAAIQLAQAQAAAAPLEPIARIASNPLLWPQDPKQQELLRNAMSGVIANAVGNLGSQQGVNNLPPPYGGGLMGILFNSFLNKKAQQSPQPIQQPANALLSTPNMVSNSSSIDQSPSSSYVPSSSEPYNNSSIPTSESEGYITIKPGEESTSNIPQAGKGIVGGAVAKQAAPYSESVHPPGTFYYDDKTNTYRSTTTPQVLSNAQVGMGAIQTAIPLLNKLQKEGKELLTDGQKLKWLTSGGAALLNNLGVDQETLKKYGISRNYYDKYVQFTSDQNNAIDKLQAAYSFSSSIPSQQKIESMINPAEFENGTAYSKRLENEKGNLLRQHQSYKQQITGGFNVTPGIGPEVPAMSDNKTESVGVVPSKKISTNNKQEKEYELYSPSGKLKGYIKEGDSNKFLKKHRGWYRMAIANG